MIVKDQITYPEHSKYAIEWGGATWTENLPEEQQDKSIRNRYETESGKFNKSGSSEIPWNDFQRMIIESIRRNHFSKDELAVIVNEIADYIKKK